MEITREQILRFIAKEEPVSIYPLTEIGAQWTVGEMERDGLLIVTRHSLGLGTISLTDKGRAELAKLPHLPKS
jgi:hypothetical protein